MFVSSGSSRYFNGLRAGGKGMLCKSDNTYYNKRYFENDSREVSFLLDEGVTDVEEGFFDDFVTLKEIAVSKTVKHIGVIDKTAELLHNNDVLVRGSFDSYAESFAKEYGLKFLHEDITLATDGDYFKPSGVDTLTLIFKPDGTPFINQDNKCQGSSSGSSGGGEADINLDADFYKTLSRQDIADMCWGSCYEKILNNEKLESFLNLAKKKNGFYFTFK